MIAADIMPSITYLYGMEEQQQTCGKNTLRRRAGEWPAAAAFARRVLILIGKSWSIPFNLGRKTTLTLKINDAFATFDRHEGDQCFADWNGNT